jgi:hypothetical protein
MENDMTKEATPPLPDGLVAFFKPPFELVEPEDDGAAMIRDANGNNVAMMFWPGHTPEETEAAEQATYELGRLFASAIRAGTPVAGGDTELIANVARIERALEQPEVCNGHHHYVRRHLNVIALAQALTQSSGACGAMREALEEVVALLGTSRQAIRMPLKALKVARQALQSAPAPGDELLAELAGHSSWELSHFGFEGEDKWQVHRVNGGRNDREWTLIGEGDTPADAILAALKEQQPSDAPEHSAKPHPENHHG